MEGSARTFLEEHCEAAIAIFDKADILGFEDMQDLSAADIETLFEGQIGTRNRFIGALLEHCTTANALVPLPLLERAPNLAITQHNCTVKGNTNISYSMSQAPKRENANGWGGPRLTKMSMSDPVGLKPWRTEGNDYVQDGHAWAGGFHATETYKLIQSKGGIGGMTEDELACCFHYSAMKVGLPFKYVKKLIPFEPVVKELFYLLETHAGMTAEKLTALKVDVGQSMRNRMTILVNGRSASKGVSKDYFGDSSRVFASVCNCMQLHAIVCNKWG